MRPFHSISKWSRLSFSILDWHTSAWHVLNFDSLKDYHRLDDGCYGVQYFLCKYDASEKQEIWAFNSATKKVFFWTYLSDTLSKARDFLLLTCTWKCVSSETNWLNYIISFSLVVYLFYDPQGMQAVHTESRYVLFSKRWS